MTGGTVVDEIAVATPTETELKLQVPPESVARLRAHPLLKRAVCHPARRLRTVYFDTPALALRDAGISLRVRRAGSEWMQTVKGSGSVQGGLHSRPEQEAALAGPVPDLSLISDPMLGAAFTPDEIRRAIQPCFTTDFRRTTWLVEPAPAVIIEVSLDRGAVRGGGRLAPLCELELELKLGPVWRLYELALALLEAVPAQLENRSKAERGYALVSGAVDLAVKSRAAAVRPGMTVEDAFTAVAWTSLDQVIGNARGVIEGRDPEFLHQMRVGVRRLRSAFRLFSAMLPEPSMQTHADAFHWLGGALGPARDWDVFLDETFPPIRAAFAGHAPLAVFERACRRRRSAAGRSARRAVASHRHQRMVLAFAGWLALQGWREGLAAAYQTALLRGVESFAAEELQRRHDRVRRRGRKLSELSAQDLHRLRIAIKQLRYATDFFASLYEPEAARELLTRLSRLQDVLGRINDAATVEHLMLDALGARPPHAQAEARGIMLGWSRGQALALRRELRAAWKAFRDCDTPW